MRPRSDGGSSMPERSWRSVLRPTAPQIAVALLLAMLAFAITLQVRHKDPADYSGVRKGDLVELLRSLDAANDRINTQVSDLTLTRNQLLDSSRKSDEATEQASKRADDLAILAGSVSAAGPGVSITIDDPERAIDAAAMLDAIEELRDAGAEVIAINGTARVVAQTYFLDDDTGVRVGGREIKPPYLIEAIGDPPTMSEAVTFRGGMADRVQNRGGTLNVATQEKITITALADIKHPEYSQPTP